MRRVEGFYWVRWDKPQVAYWDGSSWWMWGDEQPHDKTNLTVLSERLEPPKEEA